MFALIHLLHLFSFLPTVGELPFMRGDDHNFMFNPPVEHKFPTILSLDAPPAVLTLDGPPPPPFLPLPTVETVAYDMTKTSEVPLPPSHYYLFGYFLVVCFSLTMVSHSLPSGSCYELTWFISSGTSLEGYLAARG